MSNLITERWVAGEAADRGITASDTDIQNYIKQNIGGPSAFKKAAKQAGFSESQAKDQIQLIILGQNLQKAVVGTTPPSVPQETVQNFYDANKAQFSQPETQRRAPDPQQGPEPRSSGEGSAGEERLRPTGRRSPSKYSTDKATKSNGGLRKGVAKGQSEPALDAQIFSAPTGQLVGAVQGPGRSTT